MVGCEPAAHRSERRDKRKRADSPDRGLRALALQSDQETEPERDSNLREEFRSHVGKPIAKKKGLAREVPTL
jgi:hypothetical protein